MYAETNYLVYVVEHMQMWSKINKNHSVLIKIKTITGKQDIYSSKLTHHVVTIIHVPDSNLPPNNSLILCLHLGPDATSMCACIYNSFNSQKPAALSC